MKMSPLKLKWFSVASLEQHRRTHPVGARVRPDMKVVFFDEWEKPKARLKRAAGILRGLTALAEKGRKAA
jgi:transcription-repair coupling factor (superfamily II helicase)